MAALLRGSSPRSFPAGAALDPSFAALTPRERDLVELIAQGRDNAQIAARSAVSEKTVRNHITSIFAKLEVENRAQAIVLARKARLRRRAHRLNRHPGHRSRSLARSAPPQWPPGQAPHARGRAAPEQ